MPSATEWPPRTSNPRISMALHEPLRKGAVVVDDDERAIVGKLVLSE